MPDSKQLRVLLVDDHAVVREGYKRLLEWEKSISVIGEADGGQDAYRLFSERRPDVVVMDISLPGMSGIEVMRRMLMRAPDAKVLIFSMHEDEVFASQALQAGARGYLTKSSAPEVLVRAVQAVAQDQLYIDRKVMERLARRRQGGENALQRLSAREFEVFRLLAIGQTIAQISETLNLSWKTVANYQSILRQKLGVQSAVQMAWLAISQGLIGNRN
ncbi:MAG TPA: response regulator transcription factor [Burkholderiales bacterium]|nr:response regulator transcription factor [Burkholderiales bacterium]